MKKLFLVLVLFLCVSPLLFSESYLGGVVEFDIPDRLELQSEGNKAINQALSGGLKPYDIVLQQKGLNQYTDTARKQYCRVMINLDYDGATGITNKELFDDFETYSYAEKNETYNDFKAAIQMANVVKQWKGSSVVSVGGVRAIKISFERESTAENGDVYVDQYFIPAKELTVHLICSYRKDSESYFRPAIDQFLRSLKINVDSQQLYTQTLQGSRTTFLWPEKTVRWSTQTESGSVSRSISFDRFDAEGYTIALTEIYTSDRNSTKEKLMLALAQIAAQTRVAVTTSLGAYNCRLTKDTSENNSMAYRLCYTYTIIGLDVYGVVYAKILSDNSYVMVAGESILKDTPIDAVINSL